MNRDEQQRMFNRMSEIQGEKSRMSREYYQILNELAEDIQSNLKPLVGRFFTNKHGTEVFQITGVPEIKRQIIGTAEFEPEKIPVFMLNIRFNDVPHHTVITSQCYKNGVDDIFHDYIEISREVFEQVVMDKIRSITQRSITEGVHHNNGEN